jgi:cell division protein FtsB
MSKGRYRMMWTLLADLAGLILSYLFGAVVPTWIGNLLPKPLGFVHTAALWLYERPFVLLSLPHPVQSAFLHNAGLSWLLIAVLFRLGYLLRFLHYRALSKDLAKPYPGAPGEQYWEAVQRRFKDYREAIQRWEPGFTLRTPTWRYYKRLQTGQPDLFWCGRTLVLEKSLLEPERLQELGPYLARELMYFNSEDVTFRDILAYYPDRLSRQLILWHLLGFCIFLPAMLAKQIIWPSYWDERVLVADNFAYVLGQGHLLHFHIDIQVRQEESIRRERAEIAREIARLNTQWQVFQNKANIQDWSLPSDNRYYESYGSYYGSRERFNRAWNQLSIRINELRSRDLELGAQELKAHQARPMLEERRGQLAARLGTEQSWMDPRIAQRAGRDFESCSRS